MEHTMNVTCHPGTFSGKFMAPPSKSAAHRLMIASALADAPTQIEIGALSEDLEATARCLRAMDADVERADGCLRVRPIPRDADGFPALDVGESGSTLRFLLPVAAALFDGFSAVGRGRLPQRPLFPLTREMAAHGVRFSQEQLPLSARGRMAGGRFALPGDVSSQFVSGLLFALARLGGEICLTTRLESRGYVEMTLETLRQFGVRPEETADGWRCAPGAYRSPGRVRTEGDFSNAAFFLAAGAIAGRAEVTGLREDSRQGDRRVLPLLAKFGARVTRTSAGVRVERHELRGQDIDVSGIPDLLPVLAVVGAYARGETRLLNAARLRLKESDRIRSTREMLCSLGVRAEETPDSLTVFGGRVRGGTADAAGDHRIAMAAAVASVAADGPVTILGAEAVRKSFPDFFERFSQREDD